MTSSMGEFAMKELWNFWMKIDLSKRIYGTAIYEYSPRNIQARI